jgi:hypothetical protein
MNMALFPKTIMNKPLILLDVDETLIDTEYTLNISDSEWKEALRRAEAQGAVIGLNSDSACEMLRRKARFYGIRGPIVAERGALVAESPDAPTICTNPAALRFLELRDAFLQFLTKGEPLATYLTVVGHVNELSNQLPTLPEEACANEAAVLINGFRSCSLSFFVRTQQEGSRWLPDARALDDVIGMAHSLGCEQFPSLWDERDMDRDLKYGICIFHHKQSVKSLACAPLLQLFGERRIFMVGNSMSDYMGESGITHCAVGNASEEYKEHSVFVAKGERTRGVIELFERILA